jgi:LmbE family N-acetylglucosaminyl deacetylase
MNKQKTLIFFGAHPDDESFGMGAVLAKYAASGVKVYYVCATRGEAGTIDPEYMKGYADAAELRSAEMQCAAQVLGLTGVIYLGYRDSGMPGSEDNKNPKSLVLAPTEEAAGRIVKIMRDLQPDVVITHDPSGGYRHPDHIAVHNATVKAFYAAGDSLQYPEAGTAFQPGKLYYGVRSHRLLKFMVKTMAFFGQNTHKFGRNRDIDLAKMVEIEYPIHAYVRLNKEAMETRMKAAACHASQGGGRPMRRSMGIFGMVNSLNIAYSKVFGYRDYFMRAYPAPEGKRLESDLFQGI